MTALLLFRATLLKVATPLPMVVPNVALPALTVIALPMVTALFVSREAAWPTVPMVTPSVPGRHCRQ